MLARIDSCELTEWMAYSALEPWGRERENAAVIAAMIANTSREENSSPVQPHDIMTDLPAPDIAPVTATDARARMASYWATYRG